MVGGGGGGRTGVNGGSIISSSPLDLNNLPEDFARPPSDDPSTSGGGQRRKKSSSSEEDKVYECRFCSLKFCKSQALGGHMNRHRQERETESLNKARQLVFGTDNLISPYGPLPHPPTLLPPHHHHHHHHVGASGYHHHHHQPPPQIYPANTRMYSPVGSPVRLPNNNHNLHHQPPPFHVYTPSPPPVPSHPPHPQHFPPTPPHHDYFLGQPNYYSTNFDSAGGSGGISTSSNNYSCLGAPVVSTADDGFMLGSGRGRNSRSNSDGVLPAAPSDDPNGSLMSWGLINNNNNSNNNSTAAPARAYRRYDDHQIMDRSAAAPINHFQDAF